MTVQNDKWIKKMSLEHEMISPFEPKQVRGENISFGLFVNSLVVLFI